MSSVLRNTALGVAVLALGASALSALAAANVVPSTSATEQSSVPTANDIKPAECAALNLTAIVVGSGTFSGSNANELVLGSAGVDDIDGVGGDDCVLGGGSADTINGGADNDVLLGGAGADVIAGQAGNDILYGQADDDDLQGGLGTDDCHGGGDAGDTFFECETTGP